MSGKNSSPAIFKLEKPKPLNLATSRVESDENLSISRKFQKFITNNSKDFGEARKLDTLNFSSEFKDAVISQEKDSEELQTPSEKEESEHFWFGEASKLHKNEDKKIRKKSFSCKTARIKEKEKKDDKIEEQSSPTMATTNKKISEKLYKVISKFYVIKKFIKNLRNASFVRLPTKYQVNKIHILNDTAFYKEGMQKDPNERTKKTRYFSFFIKQGRSFIGFFIQILDFLMQKTKKYLKVFDPSKNFSSFWHLLHLLIIVFNFFKIPVEVSFDIDFFGFLIQLNADFFLFFQKFQFYFLLTDLLVNFNTGYYNKGSLINCRKKVAKHYLKTNFFFDLMSLIPIIFEYFALDLPHDFIKYLFFLRVKNFFQIFSRIEESVHISFRLFNLLTLLKVIARIVLLSHLFACAWYYIAYSKLQEGTDNWLAFYNLSDETWWQKYLYSYYFVCVTMNTVGYGDIVPQNSTERIYCIFFIYMACGLFAYTLNVVGDIIQKINKNKSQFLTNIMIINEYMNKKNITFDLRMRIRKYLEYVWKEEQFQNSQEENLIIEKLSSQLKDELLLETNGKALRKIPLLINNFSDETLKKLVFKVKEQHYMPGDFIFRKGDLNNSIFFLWKGQVELFIDIFKKEESFQVIEKVDQDNAFGEKEFITGREREISARSSSFSTVFVLDSNDFISVLLENYKDYCKFLEIKDFANLYNNYSSSNKNCCFCQELNHSIIDCPLLHLKLNVPRIIHKYCYQKPNERVEFKRKIKKPANARKKQNLNQFVAKTIQKEYLFTEDDNGGTEIVPIPTSERSSSNQEKISEDYCESSEDASLDFTKINNNINNIISNTPSNLLNNGAFKDLKENNNVNLTNSTMTLNQNQNKTPSHKDSKLNDKKSSEQKLISISENNVSLIKDPHSINKTSDDLNFSKGKINRFTSNNSLKQPSIKIKEKESEKLANAERTYFTLFFEKKMEFENFFPHNNSENVLRNYNSRTENNKSTFKVFSKKLRRGITRRNAIPIKKPLNEEAKTVKAGANQPKSHFFKKSENEEQAKNELDRKAIILMLKNRKKEKEKNTLEKVVGWFMKLLKED